MLSAPRIEHFISYNIFRWNCILYLNNLFDYLISSHLIHRSEKGKKYPIILRTVSRLRLFHPLSFLRSLSFIALTNVIIMQLHYTCNDMYIYGINCICNMWCLRCIISLVDTLNLWTVWCLVYLYKRVLSPIRRYLSTNFSDIPVPTIYHRLIHLPLWLAEPATHINFHMRALVRLLHFNQQHNDQL